MSPFFRYGFFQKCAELGLSENDAAYLFKKIASGIPPPTGEYISERGNPTLQGAMLGAPFGIPGMMIGGLLGEGSRQVQKGVNARNWEESMNKTLPHYEAGPGLASMVKDINAGRPEGTRPVMPHYNPAPMPDYSKTFK